MKIQMPGGVGQISTAAQSLRISSNVQADSVHISNRLKEINISDYQ